MEVPNEPTDGWVMDFHVSKCECERSCEQLYLQDTKPPTLKSDSS